MSHRQGNCTNIPSTNVEASLGYAREPSTVDLVATTGGDLLSFEGKITVGVRVPSSQSCRFFFFKDQLHGTWCMNGRDAR